MEESSFVENKEEEDIMEYSLFNGLQRTGSCMRKTADVAVPGSYFIYIVVSCC